ncbi:LON peptidase substrate-binding domain-containing protein [Tengunoibacter tsumagoiensis]|uniref:ATP-dependent protease n=1 Tax=Tengunoibacter tsumagoiensis TaxID=2014871 RepID=A0A401ZY11_9CHLR|nr:LON peptidase substrate-binding domain-containing protein [Tengunoibacter tsumagoiensis]GCE11758.1 ATP-dependent protease [Tengunoibacter tsumagoiensis]
MSTAAIELPLFPLNVVLFPGTVLPLYIFEPRYRQMIKDCQEEGKPFGIVLAREESEPLKEEPYSIGTMATIHNLNELEDGCYGLIAVGTQRFHIISQHHERPYLSGLVELYNDIDEAPDDLIAPIHQLRSLFETYLNMLLEASEEQEVEASLPTDAEELSHFIAYFLEVEDVVKQHYLELTSTSQRMREEIDVLRREIPFMRQILYKQLPVDRSRLN